MKLPLVRLSQGTACGGVHEHQCCDRNTSDSSQRDDEFPVHEGLLLTSVYLAESSCATLGPMAIAKCGPTAHTPSQAADDVSGH